MILNFIKKLLGKKIDMAYEIVDDENKCACKKCNAPLYVLYVEKNDILRTAEIICLNKNRKEF